MNGCHAHGFAWACLWGSDHAHAKPWAWHPPFWNGKSSRVGRGSARPTFSCVGGSGGSRRASTHPTKQDIAGAGLISAKKSGRQNTMRNIDGSSLVANCCFPKSLFNALAILQL